ncbi:F0F1 ATP synthase subunit epsilon [Halodesulfovibrio sp.]|uniref:F0F1 ATP synthase subunit epsilon n=1 Tax=Halodesulfovibrio sp. TaxID=1912772 RepID=UPI0025BFA412|nr:F0F1 ATP synthase subunit epsilon [Halodesulfovibrio sp.]
MENTLRLEIVTPDRLVLSEDVDYVGAPGYDGEFGILPNHIPFLAALQIGPLHYNIGGQTRYVFISGGFAEISDNKVTVLAEAAERAEDIDIDRARQAKERAEQRMSMEMDSVDYARARAALARSLHRLKLLDSE